MKTIQDTHYKDRNPQTTVANIKKILADLGVETGRIMGERKPKSERILCAWW